MFKKLRDRLAFRRAVKKRRKLHERLTGRFNEDRYGTCNADTLDPKQPLIDERGELSFERCSMYIARLEENAKMQSYLHTNEPRGVNVIGLWHVTKPIPKDHDRFHDDSTQFIKTKFARRCETEKAYFKKTRHCIESYIDTEWDKEEREIVWHYLKTKTEPAAVHGYIGNCLRIDIPTLLQNAVYTDGKYMWHASLPILIKEAGVRPPAFFVDYILETSTAGC